MSAPLPEYLKSETILHVVVMDEISLLGYVLSTTAVKYRIDYKYLSSLQ